MFRLLNNNRGDTANREGARESERESEKQAHATQSMCYARLCRVYKTQFHFHLRPLNAAHRNKLDSNANDDTDRAKQANNVYINFILYRIWFYFYFYFLLGSETEKNSMRIEIGASICRKHTTGMRELVFFLFGVVWTGYFWRSNKILARVIYFWLYTLGFH